MCIRDRGYTEADILLRLSRQRHGGMTPPTVTQPVKRYPVSYTHLDVYKRQLRDCVRTLLEYQTEDYPDEEIKAQQAKLNTLDVYKRQQQDRGYMGAGIGADSGAAGGGDLSLRVRAGAGTG